MLRKGFTLNDWIVVIVLIIGILAAMGISSIKNAQDSARNHDNACVWAVWHDLEQFCIAVELYKCHRGKYPETLTPSTAMTTLVDTSGQVYGHPCVKLPSGKNFVSGSWKYTYMPPRKKGLCPVLDDDFELHVVCRDRAGTVLSATSPWQGFYDISAVGKSK